jgi:hypothetical protein
MFVETVPDRMNEISKLRSVGSERNERNEGSERRK